MDTVKDGHVPSGVERELGVRGKSRALGVADTLPIDGTPMEKPPADAAQPDAFLDTVEAGAADRHEHRGSAARDDPGPLSTTVDARAADPKTSSYPEPLYDPSTENDAVADPLIGLVVADRYRIVERIGRGGMGIVYRVEHIRIGKLLAMKLLAGELSNNKEVVRRFKNEALTVSKLSSPHTVQVFDYGVWNHLTYLVMELVEGSDLSKVLRREGPMRFSRLGRLMLQVCASIGEAHEKGIVHRDIKPENIMIVTDPRGVEVAKVLDFGLAKIREGQELNEVTLQGAVVGTPYYISPEQVYGEEVDQRTDLYSLGAVMFRALTGTYPFQARTPMGMFTKHLTEPPPSACDRAPLQDIPRGISDAIERCMSKSADARPQTIAEIRDVILEELNALPLSSSERVFVDEESSSDDAQDARLRRRQRAVEAVASPDLAKSAMATRKELERYESKLRRTRYGAWALLAAIVLGGAGGGAYAYREGTQAFSGWEREPNNVAAEADALPLGQPLQGYLGMRVEAGKPDRDFYAFTIPPGGSQSHVAIRVSALPNMPLCTLLYRVGTQQPVAQFCPGGAGRELEVGALRLEPGDYLAVVTQDLTTDANASRFIYENVSDPYRIVVSMAHPSPTDEVEPNGSPAAAHVLAAGGEMEGMLAWVGDEDFVCVDAAHVGPIQWQVEDPKRVAGSVIEVTPYHGDSPAPLVRVHAHGTKPFGRPRLEADVTSPWASPEFDATARRCVRLRLTSDPWVDLSAAEARPGIERYKVRALQPPALPLAGSATPPPAPPAGSATPPSPPPSPTASPPAASHESPSPAPSAPPPAASVTGAAAAP